jgi:FkbM family methyltransferase
LELFDTRLGKYFLPADAPNDVIVWRMKAGQVFEAEVVDALRPYVTQGGSVIDVGANLGQMSLLFSEMVGESGKVYSIEADEYIYSILCKNIDANNRKNIQAINAAAYDRCGEKMFYPVQDFQQFGSYGSYGLEPRATEGREVATITIDSLEIQGRVDLLKVDIQGSDLFAMKGAFATISRTKPAIIFEFEQQFQEKFGTSFEQYMEFVRSINYRVERTINKINYLIVPQ